MSCSAFLLIWKLLFWAQWAGTQSRLGRGNLIRFMRTSQEQEGSSHPSLPVQTSCRPGCPQPPNFQPSAWSAHRPCGGLQLTPSTGPGYLPVHLLALRPSANIVPGGEAPGRAGTPPSSPGRDLHPVTSQPSRLPAATPYPLRPMKDKELLHVSLHLEAVTATRAA